MKKKLLERVDLTKQDIVSLLSSDANTFKGLLKDADSLRKKKLGKDNIYQGLITFSNNCERSCFYCGIRKANENILRFRLNEDQIIQTAIKAAKSGYKHIILESGEDNEFGIDSYIRIAAAVKDKSDISISLSVGEKQEIEYKKLKESNIDGYIIKHETSDPMLYRQLHPDLKYADRIKCLRSLKNLKFNTGSGILIGLPGQTLESIANDILLFQSLEIDSIIISPYIPHPSTPLARKLKQAGGYFIPALGYFNLEEMIYKVIAITRLVNEDADIMVNSSLAVLNKSAISKALNCGANVVIENVTESKFRKRYEVFPEKIANKKDLNGLT